MDTYLFSFDLTIYAYLFILSSKFASPLKKKVLWNSLQLVSIFSDKKPAQNEENIPSLATQKSYLEESLYSAVMQSFYIFESKSQQHFYNQYQLQIFFCLAFSNSLRYLSLLLVPEFLLWMWCEFFFKYFNWFAKLQIFKFHFISTDCFNVCFLAFLCPKYCLQTS